MSAKASEYVSLAPISATVASFLESMVEKILMAGKYDDKTKEIVQKTMEDIARLSSIYMEVRDKRAFECLVCQKNLRAPILNCHSVHSFCELCKAGQMCPVDSYPLPKPDVRNKALENIIQELELPLSCQYHKHGCELSALMTELIFQETKCRYRPVHCQVIHCYEEIQFHKFEDHMTSCYSGLTELLPISYTILIRL
jgi:hypothetical protein